MFKTIKNVYKDLFEPILMTIEESQMLKRMIVVQ